MSPSWGCPVIRGTGSGMCGKRMCGMCSTIFNSRSAFTASSTIIKYKKRVAVRVSRQALLETMDEICSATSRQQWQQQLSVVYRKRSIDLKNPGSYNAKTMDEFLQSTFIGTWGWGFVCCVTKNFELAPDRHAAEAELLEREREECDEPGLVKMIANGLQLQIEQ